MFLPVMSVPVFSALLPPGLFGGVSSGEILVVLVVVLLIFGPKQLPDLAKTIGQALRGVRKATDDLKAEIGLDELVRPGSSRRVTRQPIPTVPPPAERAAIPPASAPPADKLAAATGAPAATAAASDESAAATGSPAAAATATAPAADSPAALPEPPPGHDAPPIAPEEEPHG